MHDAGILYRENRILKPVSAFCKWLIMNYIIEFMRLPLVNGAGKPLKFWVYKLLLCGKLSPAKNGKTIYSYPEAAVIISVVEKQELDHVLLYVPVQGDIFPCVDFIVFDRIRKIINFYQVTTQSLCEKYGANPWVRLKHFIDHPTSAGNPNQIIDTLTGVTGHRMCADSWTLQMSPSGFQTNFIIVSASPRAMWELEEKSNEEMKLPVGVYFIGRKTLEQQGVPSDNSPVIYTTEELLKLKVSNLRILCSRHGISYSKKNKNALLPPWCSNKQQFSVSATHNYL
eukprot:TRINITY_DN2397_c0_g1_i7.p1 TRINITY_DN2397_c0_g1~~TRINITY_DN2397_c0_g1_i7.p1  ORF type:complete len:284 (-),score=28.28 TRINITY_DN2397_c0_g1_i7:148-999(-)